MRLGVVKDARQSGKRILLDVRMDEGLYRDVVLVHALHVRSRVGEGSRVFVGQIDGEDTTLLAWPIEFAGQVEDVGLIRDESTSILLRDGEIEVFATKFSVAGGAPLATKADIDALTAAVNALIALHNAHAAATGLGAPATPASPAIGTLVLEAK